MSKKKYFAKASELVEKMTLEEKISLMQHTASAIPRLGIKQYNWWNEACHGLARSGTATVFPEGLAVASSFNTELMQEMADAISSEVRAKYNEYKKQGFTDIYQGLTVAAPFMNILRDPRWGRGVQTYGEDPYLTGRMATAYVKGLEGEGEYIKAAAILKHFAVHSGPETGRLKFNAEVSEKDLNETYLPAFAYCIKNADPAGVMTAYNAIDHLPCCVNRHLIQDILRGEMDFEGFVISDAGAHEYGFENQKLTDDLTEFGAISVKCGCDISIGDPGKGFAYRNLAEAYQKGFISEEEITAAVVRLVELYYKLGMFDDNCVWNQIPFEIIDSEAHQSINQRMAAEGIILLKNDGILPLKEDASIAVIGPNADDRLVLLGMYYGCPSHTTTFLDGIRKGSKGKVVYSRGCTPTDCYEDAETSPRYEAVIAAEHSDIVVMVMGTNPTMEGEECEFGKERTSFELPEDQKEVYELVKKTGKPIVFVNVSGSCVNLSSMKAECNALFQCFYPGAEGGTAFADILFGKVSPSGRLPMTFYKDAKELPPFDDYSMKGRTYKFFEGTPVFEFGYGLTYSDIREKRIDADTVEVTNNGPFDTMYSVLNFQKEPDRHLVGFEKIFIKNGETKTVVFRHDK